MQFTLPKIYPITDTTTTSLSHTEQVRQLLQGGATLIQLREKLATPRGFIGDAREALIVARAAGAVLIINDRVDIALALQADGVHLGQTDMPVPAARQLLGDRAIIGLSTHNLEQAKKALELPIDYLALGPIFATKTKSNPDQVVGLKQLTEIKVLAGAVPVVAIGGIDKSRVRETLLAGADSVAIISALLSEPARIPENLRILTQECRNLESTSQ